MDYLLLQTCVLKAMLFVQKSITHLQQNTSHKERISLHIFITVHLFMYSL